MSNLNASHFYFDDPASDTEVTRIFKVARRREETIEQLASRIADSFAFDPIPPADYPHLLNLGDAMVYVARRIEEERD